MGRRRRRGHVNQSNRASSLHPSITIFLPPARSREPTIPSYITLSLSFPSILTAAKKTPLDDIRTTLESVKSKLESKLDRLLADNESLRPQHAAATAENERLRASNAELAASVRAIGASLADARTDTCARMLYGLRAAEHAAREQRVLLRELSERVERVEYEGGIGMPGLGMGMGTGGGLAGWG